MSYIKGRKNIWFKNGGGVSFGLLENTCSLRDSGKIDIFRSFHLNKDADQKVY